MPIFYDISTLYLLKDIYGDIFAAAWRFGCCRGGNIITATHFLRFEVKNNHFPCTNRR
jgi:hypothetical protein